MRTMQAYRFALALTPAQERAVLTHAGAARVAFNWALARVRAVMDQRAAELSYGMADENLTPTLEWSLPALRRAWNLAKEQVAPWWRECSKEAYNTGLDALARALKNWSDARAGRSARRGVGFPRFKARHRSVPVVRFSTGAIRVEPDRHHVVLPRLGRLKTYESTRKLSRRVESGTARILSATVRRDGLRWHVAFCVEVDRSERRPTRPAAVVGVDLGITRLVVLSNGRVLPNPRHLDGALRKLRRLGRASARRTTPNRRRGQPPSKRWLRTHAALVRTHQRVTSLRRDNLHKISTNLTREFGTIVVEDLNVTGMLRNRRLARHISDAGFGELRRQLRYKADWHGNRLVVADRWYPSSKTCSACGAVKAKLALSERIYTCISCGLTLDRDLNAARNLAALAGGVSDARSGRESSNGRGADRKTRRSGPVAVKRQPGTASADQTGTVPPRGGTPIGVRTREH
ncbi:IS607 family element RNA-guided endonuclease TnpB [Micromonospora phytophila]|uniref:IS607 family element RNA-guided endonuclease TnpB n=1 Tax=Micromonospora phytophila TaxID=709888 RepID=UPI00202FCD2E|nr:IS607 family element RNA-guided endonuclease TnpB [Micromonospora phytophila]MCM0678809.1 IS607 family element RNA-guided endonuclease TnpB [Micromonospora phytophila]